MSDTITTNSNKVSREITLKKPDVLLAENLQDVIEILGEDVTYVKIMAQLTIDFRAKVRAMLESMSDNEYNYSDEDITQMDFSDWKPEARQRKSKIDKANEMFGKLSPEEIQAVLIKMGINVVE